MLSAVCSTDPRKVEVYLAELLINAQLARIAILLIETGKHADAVEVLADMASGLELRAEKT